MNESEIPILRFGDVLVSRLPPDEHLDVRLSASSEPHERGIEIGVHLASDGWPDFTDPESSRGSSMDERPWDDVVSSALASTIHWLGAAPGISPGTCIAGDIYVPRLVSDEIFALSDAEIPPEFVPGDLLRRESEFLDLLRLVAPWGKDLVLQRDLSSDFGILASFRFPLELLPYPWRSTTKIRAGISGSGLVVMLKESRSAKRGISCSAAIASPRGRDTSFVRAQTIEGAVRRVLEDQFRFAPTSPGIEGWWSSHVREPDEIFVDLESVDFYRILGEPPPWLWPWARLVEWLG